MYTIRVFGIPDVRPSRNTPINDLMTCSAITVRESYELYVYLDLPSLIS